MPGSSYEFVERYRSKVISTVLTAEYTGDLDAVFSPWSKRQAVEMPDLLKHAYTSHSGSPGSLPTD
jgi:hypothetical protein